MSLVGKSGAAVISVPAFRGGGLSGCCYETVFIDLISCVQAFLESNRKAILQLMIVLTYFFFNILIYSKKTITRALIQKKSFKVQCIFCFLCRVICSIYVYFMDKGTKKKKNHYLQRIAPIAFVSRRRLYGHCRGLHAKFIRYLSTQTIYSRNNRYIPPL